MVRRLLALAILSASTATAVFLAGCGGDEPVERLTVRVEATRPHDPSLFTQGLEQDGPRIIESAGGRGTSLVRITDAASGRTLHEARLEPALFGEGISADADRIVQLTWTSGRALIWDRQTLAPRGEWRYRGEGWGLCRSDEGWVMSDGSDTLTVRDPESFDVRRRMTVTNDGTPVAQLNELECVDGSVYANVWMSDTIVRIDGSGKVTATIDASVLEGPPDRAPAAVLNGIARIPGTNRFLLTGKYWPTMYEVSFVPQAGQ